MVIDILRGQNQIGGSIIAVSTDNTKIILDVGINLDESEKVEIPQIKGLFCDGQLYDAVIISHYHSDHIGLLNYVLRDVPIYMGKQAYEIVKASNSYIGKSIEFSHLEYGDGVSFQVGELLITPYKCDHSAFDSYMFAISDGYKTVLYTGDFRANGRNDYELLLSKLPKVDALIVEGTMLSRETFQHNIYEESLEDIAIGAIKKYNGPAFLMASAMNVDRIITGYNVARKTGRLFLEDLYTAGIMDAIGKDVPAPGTEGVKVFMTGGDKQYELLKKYAHCKIGKKGIAHTDFLMCIRPSMIHYLKRLNEIYPFEDGILFYSMWKGYQEREDMKEFLDYMKSKGVSVHTLHTSGHADIETINRLLDKVKPKMIVPVHTENPEWYLRYGVPVLLKDTGVVL